MFYNQVIHYQFYENIINWCDMDKARFKMVFMKTHSAYQHSTSNFWNFSLFEKSRDTLHIPIHKTLQTDNKKERDSFTLHLPPLALNDSFLLMTIRLKCRMEHHVNESYLRLFLENNGEYIDLRYFLLKRKVNLFDQVQEINYEFHIEKPLPEAKLYFDLESVDGKSITKLEVEEICVSRIKF